MQQATEYSTDAHALNVALGEIQSDTENMMSSFKYKYYLFS